MVNKKTIQISKVLHLFILLLLSASTTIFSQIPGLQWAKKVGGTNQDEGHSISIDSLGNTYVLGGFYGTADFDPGPGTYTLTSSGGMDIFVLKLNSLGNLVWVKKIGGINDDKGLGIQVDKVGNVFHTGNFQGVVDFDPGPASYTMTTGGSSRLYIQKLDSNGKFVWTKGIGCFTNSNTSNAITIDDSINVYTTGDYGCSGVDFDPGPGTYTLGPQGNFILKLDSSGNFKWAKAFGGVSSSGVTIKLDRNKNIYTAGSFGGIADFDPGPTTYTLNSSAGPGYITKLDQFGNLIWISQIGAGINALAVDSAYTVYLTGGFSGVCDFDPGPSVFTYTALGSRDFFVERLDANGNFLWAKKGGGSSGCNCDVGKAVDVDRASNVYVTGNYNGTVDFDPGPATFNLASGNNNAIFTWKLDASGNFVWAFQIGNGASFNYNEGKAILVDRQNNIYSTGLFTSTANFNPTGSYSLTSSGGYECYIQKLGSGSPTNINLMQKENLVELFPNPSSGVLQFKQNSDKNLQLIIVNILGEKVKDFYLSGKVGQLDISSLNQGIYNYIILENGQSVKNGKLVVQ